MGVQEVDRLGLGHGVAQDMHQHGMLEHVGKAAGMEGVAVAEHAISSRPDGQRVRPFC